VSPEENLWLEILRRSDELKKLPLDEARQTLLEANFPKHIIDAYVREIS
jgi:hypothetical protein